MTPPARPISRLPQEKRIQVFCRHLYERLPSRPAVLVVLVLLIGALTVTALPVLLQPDESPPPVIGANESTTEPGAQLARAIAAKRTHLTRALHQRPLDPTPTPSPTSTETESESDADDDSREGTEIDNDDEEVQKTATATDSNDREDT